MYSMYYSYAICVILACDVYLTCFTSAQDLELWYTQIQVNQVRPSQAKAWEACQGVPSNVAKRGC